MGWGTVTPLSIFGSQMAAKFAKMDEKFIGAFNREELIHACYL